MLQTTSRQQQQEGSAPAHEPKSAHATSVTEKYVEKRKEKAENQVQRERKTTKFTDDKWKKIHYALL